MNLRHILTKAELPADDIIELKATVDFLLGIDEFAIKDNYLYFLRDWNKREADNYLESVMEFDTKEEIDEWIKDNIR